MWTQLPLPKRGRAPNFWPMFIVAKQFDGSGWPGIQLVYYITKQNDALCGQSLLCNENVYRYIIYAIHYFVADSRLIKKFCCVHSHAEVIGYSCSAVLHSYRSTLPSTSGSMFTLTTGREVCNQCNLVTSVIKRTFLLFVKILTLTRQHPRFDFFFILAQNRDFDVQKIVTALQYYSTLNRQLPEADYITDRSRSCDHRSTSNVGVAWFDVIYSYSLLDQY